MRRDIALLIVGAFAVAGCSRALTPSATPAAESAAAPVDSAPRPATEAAAPVADVAAINVRVEDDRAYSFSQLIPFDGIRPVYEPEFVGADEALLMDDELVIGVFLGGEAKAYPITVLRFREMVNDELGGIPILVTW